MENKEGADTNPKFAELIQENLEKEAFSIYGLDDPLDPSKKEIRLLSLHDSEDANALLSGQLQRTTLDDDYTALSYVWGDERNRRPIQLNGVHTTITANLEAVLKQLRAEKKAIKIWIDALCIDQR